MRSNQKDHRSHFSTSYSKRCCSVSVRREAYIAVSSRAGGSAVRMIRKNKDSNSKTRKKNERRFERARQPKSI